MNLNTLEQENKLYNHKKGKEEDSFSFGLMALQLYATIKADDVYRAYTIGKNAVDAGTNTPSYINFGVPFFDGKFGTKAPNPDKVFNFSTSFGTVGAGTPVGKYGVEMASHYNNSNIIENFKNTGAYTDNELNIMKEFVETKPDNPNFNPTQNTSGNKASNKNVKPKKPYYQKPS